MSIVFGLLILVGVLFIVLVILGYFLPTSYTIDEAILLNAEADEIFPLLNVLENWKNWTVWNEENGLELSYEGPASGSGAILLWEGSQIQAKLKVHQVIIPSNIEFIMELDQAKFFLKGTIVLDATMPLVTQVAWRSELSLPKSVNPVHRFQVYFLRNYIETSMKTSLLQLSNLFKGQEETSSGQ
jgi:hypothetical protein